MLQPAVEQVARGMPAAQVGAGLAAPGLHGRTVYTRLATEHTAGREALRVGRWAPGRPSSPMRSWASWPGETDPRDHGSAVALCTREVVRQLDRR